nr:hypothetical protein [Candidatus Freyarchaeota archaeon]
MEKDAKWKLYRPERITALAIILIIIGVLGIIAICILETCIALGYNFTLSNQGTLFALVLIDLVSILTNLLHEIVLVHSTILIANQSIITGLHLVVLAGLTFSGYTIITGVGLLYMKKWAYYLAVALLVFVVFCLLIIRILLAIT